MGTRPAEISTDEQRSRDLNELITYLSYASSEVASQDSAAAKLLKLCILALERRRVSHQARAKQGRVYH